MSGPRDPSLSGGPLIVDGEDDAVDHGRRVVRQVDDGSGDVSNGADGTHGNAFGNSATVLGDVEAFCGSGGLDEGWRRRVDRDAERASFQCQHSHELIHGTLRRET